MTTNDARDGNLGEVIDRRVQVYGEPVGCFTRIAEVWSGIIGHHINPVEVPLMMVGMKLVRAQVMPDYGDNSDDVDGYMDIFRKIVGDDMIAARSVNEFIEKKWPEPQLPRIWKGVCAACAEGQHSRCADSKVIDCTCYDNGHV
jgi:hypothetical protein